MSEPMNVRYSFQLGFKYIMFKKKMFYEALKLTWYVVAKTFLGNHWSEKIPVHETSASLSQ